MTKKQKHKKTYNGSLTWVNRNDLFNILSHIPYQQLWRVSWYQVPRANLFHRQSAELSSWLNQSRSILRGMRGGTGFLGFALDGPTSEPLISVWLVSMSCTFELISSKGASVTTSDSLAENEKETSCCPRISLATGVGFGSWFRDSGERCFMVSGICSVHVRATNNWSRTFIWFMWRLLRVF